MSSSIFIYDKDSIKKIISNKDLQKYVFSHTLHENKRLEEEGINHSLLEIIPKESTSESELTSKIHDSCGVIKVLPSNHIRSILINDVNKSFSIDEVYFSILKLGVKEETFQRLFLFDDPSQPGLNLGYALIEFDSNLNARKSISLLGNNHSGVTLHCNDVDYFLDQFVKVVSLSYISTSEKYDENDEDRKEDKENPISNKNMSFIVNNEKFVLKIKSEFEKILGNKSISKIRIYSESILVVFNKTLTVTMINSVVSRIKIGNFKVKSQPFRVPSQNPSNKYKEKRSLNLNLLVKEDSQMILSLLNQNINKKEMYEKYENEYFSYVNRKNKERKEEEERREAVLKNKRLTISNEKEKEKEKNYRKDKSYKSEDNVKYEKYEKYERNEKEKEKTKTKPSRDENKQQKQFKSELSSYNIDTNTINLLSAFIKNNDKSVFNQILPSIIALLSSIKNIESSKLSNQIQLIIALYNTKVLHTNQDLTNNLIQQLIDFAVQPSVSSQIDETQSQSGFNNYMTMTEYQSPAVGNGGSGGNTGHVNNNNTSNNNYIKNHNHNHNLTFPVIDNNHYSYYPNNIHQNTNTNQVNSFQDMNTYQKQNNYLNNIDTNTNNNSNNYLFNPIPNQPIGFNFHSQVYPSHSNQSNSFMNFPNLLNKNQQLEIEQGQIIDPNYLLLQYQNFPYGNIPSSGNQNHLLGNLPSIGSNPSINSTNQNMNYGFK